MIKHMVMWKIKDEFEGMKKPEIMNKIKDMLKALEDKIDVVKSIEISESQSSGHMHYDMGLIVTVESMEDLPKYVNHPEHLKCREFISKVRTDRVTADIVV